MSEPLQSQVPPNGASPQNSDASEGSLGETGFLQRQVLVLLVDDQALVGESVRRMLANEPGIFFHYCSSACEAVRMAASCVASSLIVR